MGDWDFLNDMKAEGYNEKDIRDAQATGAMPKQWAEIAKQEKEEREAELEKRKSLWDIEKNPSE